MSYFSMFEDSISEPPRQLPKSLPYFVSSYYNNLYELEYYYRTRNFSIKRPNPFISLIHDMSIYMDKDVFELYDILTEVHIHLSNKFGFVSSANIGKGLTNVIFDNVAEIFIVEEYDDVNLLELEDNWRDLKPIKVISTDNLNLIISHPYGVSLQASFVIYKVNIVELVLQYKLWMIERVKNNDNIDIAIYLHQYPFLSIIDSLNKYTYYNNLFFYLNNKYELETLYDKNVGGLTNLDNFLYRANNEYKKIILKQRYKDYYDFAKRVLIMDKTIDELNRFVSYVDNENMWVYMLAMLNNLSSITDYIKKDREFTNDILLTIFDYEKRSISRKLEPIDRMLVESMIENIKEKIK